MTDMTNKEQYAAFCEQHPEMPIMMQPWWLDAVCAGKHWDVLLFTRQEIKAKCQEIEIVAAMPYLLRKRLGYKFIVMPQMTMFGGVWVTDEVQESPDMQKCLAKLIAKRLREMKVAYYEQKFTVGNPIPELLGKRQMRCTERVTYRIDDLSSIEDVEDSFSKNKKRQLRKAEGLQVDYDMTAEEFYRFHTDCMRERKRKLTYSREFLLVLERKARRAGQSAFIRITTTTPAVETSTAATETNTAAAQEPKTVAAAFVVWDKNYLYYLIPAYLPSAADTGASARLADEAIRLAKEKGLRFDFEGGNDDAGIANHYKQFGAQTVTYHSVTKLYRPSFAGLLLLNKWKERINISR